MKIYMTFVALLSVSANVCFASPLSNQNPTRESLSEILSYDFDCETISTDDPRLADLEGAWKKRGEILSRTFNGFEFRFRVYSNEPSRKPLVLLRKISDLNRRDGQYLQLDSIAQHGEAFYITTWYEGGTGNRSYRCEIK
ncbi:MAG: hypothetical protein AAGB31_11135 [Bdellovibrio sp.]